MSEKLIVKTVDERVKSFLDLRTPCDFPGCQELRTRYTSEMKKQKKGCASCQRMAVVRKYKTIVKGRLGG
jgi:hypothetical protein